MEPEHIKSIGNGIKHLENNERIQSVIKNGTTKYHNNEKSPRQKNDETKQLPDKEFKIRNSLLIDLIEKNPHIRTIYYICLAVFIYWVINTGVHDYIREGRIIIGTDLMVSEFRNLHFVGWLWLLLTLEQVIVFYLFKFWATIRITMVSPKGNYLKIWDIIGLVTYVIYFFSSFVLSSSVITIYHLTVSAAAIISLEQTRYLMKVHSCLRQNAEKVLKYKTHSDKELKLPTLSQFVYFLFAPTMIYRDEYPRTDTIRWKFVASRFIETVLCIFVLSFAMQNLAMPPYKEFGETKNKWKEIVLYALQNCGPSILIYLTAFFVTLHSVQNLFAEILRFGDRLFYEDWWNCTGYLSFFRSWNILVGDWLYLYVYKDVQELLIPNKYVAKFTVFMISAIVHEWIMSTCFGFVLPVLFMEMLLSGCFALRKDPKNQAATILMWVGLLLGNGFNATVYGLEYFIRYTTLLESNVISNTLIPQIYLLGE